MSQSYLVGGSNDAAFHCQHCGSLYYLTALLRTNEWLSALCGVCVYVWLILHLTLEAVCMFVFRMVVLFDDCCHKIELRLRHIRLQVSVCSQLVLLACSSLSSCVSFTPWFVLVTVICWPRHVHWIAKLWPIAGDIAWSVSCLCVCWTQPHRSQ